MAGEAWGQDRSDAPTPRFGTADSLVWAVNGLGFGPNLAVDATLLGVSDESRKCLATCFLVASLHLPAGAVVERIELDACDTDASGEISLKLSRMPAGHATSIPLATVNTGDPNNRAASSWNLRSPTPRPWTTGPTPMCSVP
jgi:hypothetical protein